MSANALSKPGRNAVRMTSFWRMKFQTSHNPAGVKGRWSHLWVDLRKFNKWFFSSHSEPQTMQSYCKCEDPTISVKG